MAAIYTVEEHVRRLELMLDICGRPCNACPASDEFDSFNSEQHPEDLWVVPDEQCHPCYICQQFVGLTPVLYGLGTCPCLRLGRQALHVTDEKIAEFYRGQMK